MRRTRPNTVAQEPAIKGRRRHHQTNSLSAKGGMKKEQRKICLWLVDVNDHLGLDGFRLLGEPGDIGALDLAVHGLGDYAGDLVWVTVGGRAAVLEVALALGCDSARDTDGGTAVGDAPGELVVGGSLVLAGHAELVV